MTVTAIKLLLILTVLALLVWGFRNRRRTAMRASLRVLGLVIAGFAIVSIADPSLTTKFARILGVGRGTDLLLYVAVVTFGVATLGLYFRSRQLEQRFNALTRAIAIAEAIASADAPLPRASSAPVP